MSKQRLHEAGALVEAKRVNGVFAVRIITEGKGSSGVYTKELLQEYASAFNGSPSFMNHPVDPSRPDQRDITSIAGKIVSEVRYEERDGLGGLYADLKVDERWAQFVEDYADVIGLSVYIEGEGRKESGEYIVESFNGSDPYKSVDWVVAAGRGGQVERAMESLRLIESSVGTPPVSGTVNPAGTETKREKLSMEQDVKDAFERLNATITEALKPLAESVSALVEAAKPVTPTDEVSLAEAAKKLGESGLPAIGISRVAEKFENDGGSLDALIAAEQAYVKSLVKESAPAAPAFTIGTGRVVEGAEAKFSLTKIAEVA